MFKENWPERKEKVTCPSCKGTGKDERERACARCGGSGKVDG
jgi:RecJ-like exonuclease